MAEEPKKKNIFDAAIDALTDRDEKAAAAEAAKKQAEEAARQAELARAKAEQEKAKAAGEAARKKLEEEERKAKMDADLKAMNERKQREAEEAARKAKMEADMKAMNEKKQQEAAAAAQAARAAEEAARKAATVKHVWTKDDTYASLAQHYYGSFKEPYWRLIYEHNKAIIGNHPNAIREGLEIEIPPLPDELKKK